MNINYILDTIHNTKTMLTQKAMTFTMTTLKVSIIVMIAVDIPAVVIITATTLKVSILAMVAVDIPAVVMNPDTESDQNTLYILKFVNNFKIYIHIILCAYIYFVPTIISSSLPNINDVDLLKT